MQSPRQTVRVRQPLPCPDGRPVQVQLRSRSRKLGPAVSISYFPTEEKGQAHLWALASPLASVSARDLLCRIRSRSPRRGVLRSAPPPPPLAGRRCIDAAAMVSSTPSFPSSSSALTTHFQVPPPRISDFIGADRIWLSGRRDRAAARRGDRDHPPRSRWPGSVGLGFVVQPRT